MKVMLHAGDFYARSDRIRDSMKTKVDLTRGMTL